MKRNSRLAASKHLATVSLCKEGIPAVLTPVGLSLPRIPNPRPSYANLLYGPKSDVELEIVEKDEEARIYKDIWSPSNSRLLSSIEKASVILGSRSKPNCTNSTLF